MRSSRPRQKVDVRWWREDLDGPLKYFVEAKHHASTLGIDERREFLQDYGTLVDGGLSAHECATFVSLASHKWPILNLGLRFSNKCGVRLNIRRMDGFISMIILQSNVGGQRHESRLELHIRENVNEAG